MSGPTAQSAVPLKIRVVEAPGDAALDYALYQILLSLKLDSSHGAGQGGQRGAGIRSTATSTSSPSSATQDEVSWAVLRRYSEFVTLKEALGDLIPESDNNLFPGKHALRSSKDPVVVQERLKQLPRWLVAISKYSQITTSPVFRAFLSLDQFEGELARAAANLSKNYAGASQMQLEQTSEAGTPQPIPRSTAAAAGSSTISTSGGSVGSPATSTGIGASTAGDSVAGGAPGRRPTALPKHLTTAGGLIPSNAPNLPSPIRLVAGHGQPGGEGDTEMETATAALVPSGPTASGIGGGVGAGGGPPAQPMRAFAEVPAPPHAGDEFASAQASVDLRVPHLTVPPDQVVRPVQEELADTRRTAQEAARLKAEADSAALLAQEKAMLARQIAAQEHGVESEMDAARRAAEIAEANARRLRDEVNAKQKALSELKKEEAKRMREYEDSVKNSADLAGKARNLDQEAVAKAAHAVAEHERATNELLQAEKAVEEAAEHEEHRQISEAAAAAARAKKLVTLAAKEKAEEEAAIQAAHLAAAEEAEAIALLNLAQERARQAAARKEELEIRANQFQESAAAHTKLAAQASAEQDAHQKAAGVSHRQALAAESALHATEAERASVAQQLAAGQFAGSGISSSAIRADVAAGKGTHVPHEGVKLDHRTLAGTGTSLTTTGTEAASKMSHLKIAESKPFSPSALRSAAGAGGAGIPTSQTAGEALPEQQIEEHRSSPLPGSSPSSPERLAGAVHTELEKKKPVPASTSTGGYGTATGAAHSLSAHKHF